jgi:hypothetical protein
MLTTRELDNADLQACIDLCLECHRTCLQTVTHCLIQGGEHAEADHIRIMEECAEACQLAAHVMLRGSDMHKRTCGLCAEFCLRCAEECERFDDDEQMKKCASMCRRCADSCGQMATS